MFGQKAAAPTGMEVPPSSCCPPTSFLSLSVGDQPLVEAQFGGDREKRGNPCRRLRLASNGHKLTGTAVLWQAGVEQPQRCRPDADVSAAREPLKLSDVPLNRRWTAMPAPRI
jgi:hypothetical protein